MDTNVLEEHIASILKANLTSTLEMEAASSFEDHNLTNTDP
jgi:hypothetical protein